MQYAFLELPKVPAKRPETAGAGLWAWLFAHATDLTDIPRDLAPGPHRDALQLANQAKFTKEELESYERTRDEIQQVLEIAAAREAKGRALGKIEGKIEGKMDALLAVFAARGLTVGVAARERVERCLDAAVLDRWIARAVVATSVDEARSDSD